MLLLHNLTFYLHCFDMFWSQCQVSLSLGVAFLAANDVDLSNLQQRETLRDVQQINNYEEYVRFRATVTDTVCLKKLP